MLKNEIGDVSPGWIQCQDETDAETMELVQIAFVLIEKNLKAVLKPLNLKLKWTAATLIISSEHTLTQKLVPCPNAVFLTSGGSFSQRCLTMAPFTLSHLLSIFIMSHRASEFLRKADFEFIYQSQLLKLSCSKWEGVELTAPSLRC